MVQTHWRSVNVHWLDDVKHCWRHGERDGMPVGAEVVADWALAPRAAMAARRTTRVEIMVDY